LGFVCDQFAIIKEDSLKLVRGTIDAIEFTVQIHQLIHVTTDAIDSLISFVLGFFIEISLGEGFEMEFSWGFANKPGSEADRELWIGLLAESELGRWSESRWFGLCGWVLY
jgi:hypothetical protein